MAIYDTEITFPRAGNRERVYRELLEAQTKSEAFLIATARAAARGFKGQPVSQKAQLYREVEA